MEQWGVVQVIVVLVGLFITVGAPVIRLNSTIVKLTATVNNLGERFEKFEGDNSDSHKGLWLKNEAQDKVLNDHETRIKVLER